MDIYLDDVLGHVDLVSAKKVKHVNAGVLARKRQHRNVEVNSKLREQTKQKRRGEGEEDGGGRGGGARVKHVVVVRRLTTRQEDGPLCFPERFPMDND